MAAGRFVFERHLKAALVVDVKELSINSVLESTDGEGSVRPSGGPVAGCDPDLRSRARKAYEHVLVGATREALSGGLNSDRSEAEARA